MRKAALRCVDHLQRQTQHQEDKHQLAHGRECISMCKPQATAFVTGLIRPDSVPAVDGPRDNLAAIGALSLLSVTRPRPMLPNTPCSNPLCQAVRSAYCRCQDFFLTSSGRCFNLPIG
jgi:hypothetical protein